MVSRAVLCLMLVLIGLVADVLGEETDGDEIKSRTIEAIDGLHSYRAIQYETQEFKLTDVRTGETEESTLRGYDRGWINSSARGMRLWRAYQALEDDEIAFAEDAEAYVSHDRMYMGSGNNWTLYKMTDADAFWSNHTALLIASLMERSEVEVAGSDLVDGTKCTKLELQPEKELYASMLSGLLTSTPPKNGVNLEEIYEDSSIRWTLWVEEESSLPRKLGIDLRAALPPDLMTMMDETSSEKRGALRIQVVLMLYDLNARINDDRPSGLTATGEAAGGSFNWTSENFPGFVPIYDEGTESLSVIIDENDGDGGSLKAIYENRAKKVEFDHKGWGSYYGMVLDGELCLAGYDESTIMAEESIDDNLMAYSEISKMLIDNDRKISLDEGSRLELEEGYDLLITSINAEETKMLLELQKYGETIEEQILAVPRGGGTYLYKTDLGSADDLVTIAVHFRSLLNGPNRNIAMVDGIWQISDEPEEVPIGRAFGSMRVEDIDDSSMKLVMESGKLAVVKGDIPLTDGMGLRIIETSPLKYYPHKDLDIEGPIIFRVGGTVAGGNFTWMPDNFGAFRLEPDSIDSESLMINVTGESGRGPAQIIYESRTIGRNFSFEGWGSYDAIGLLGQRYFTGYRDDRTRPREDQVLLEISGNRSTLSSGYIDEILMDDASHIVLSSEVPLFLRDGYEIILDMVNEDETKAYIMLARYGDIFEEDVIEPGRADATLVDGTYCHYEVLGDLGRTVVIAVHFSNLSQSGGESYATVDGIWQISDDPFKIYSGGTIEGLTIEDIDLAEGRIVMGNRYYRVTLDRDRDLPLAPGISIRTQDSDELKYFIYAPLAIQ